MAKFPDNIRLPERMYVEQTPNSKENQEMVTLTPQPDICVNM